MLSHIMRSLFLLSLLHQMFLTAGLYNITCMSSVAVQCGGTAIVNCNHTAKLDRVTIDWKNTTERNLTLDIINEITLSEDRQVSVEATGSEVKLKIHNVLVSDDLNVTASTEKGFNMIQINLSVEGVCDSEDSGNGIDDSDDPNTQQLNAKKTERYKFVAVSVLGILAGLLALAILVYKKGVGRWKHPKSRGRLFSQSSLMRESEEESYLENPPADTT